MNDFDEIRGMKTVLRPVEYMGKCNPFEIDLIMLSKIQSMKLHESLLRSYHILDKVKRLLANGTPAGVVVDLIEMMETPLPEAEKLEQEVLDDETD
ncbi:MAG: hypothetical protein JRI53_04475 [Deltaproteobacteria bacterium]|nr:hypothetical protein [Deltaproteobacteria bacterium]